VRESTGEHRLDFHDAVGGARTANHFLHGLHEQEKADAEEASDGRGGYKPNGDEVE
jgi:hypothetical protein